MANIISRDDYLSGIIRMPCTSRDPSRDAACLEELRSEAPAAEDEQMTDGAIFIPIGGNRPVMT